MVEPRTMVPAKQLLKAIGHYAIALALALKGISKIGHGDGYGPFVGLCLVAALVIVAATALHRRLERLVPSIEAIVYLLEALVGGSIAYLSFREGKHALPWAWVAVSIMFAALSVVFFTRGIRERRGGA
jgi:drug/metabolite transporter (DMT)-like permease